MLLLPLCLMLVVISEEVFISMKGLILWCSRSGILVERLIFWPTGVVSYTERLIF